MQNFYKLEVTVTKTETQHSLNNAEYQDYPFLEEIVLCVQIGNDEMASVEEIRRNLELVSASLLSFAQQIPEHERRLLGLSQNFLDAMKAARRL